MQNQLLISLDANSSSPEAKVSIKIVYRILLVSFLFTLSKSITPNESGFYRATCSLGDRGVEDYYLQIGRTKNKIATIYFSPMEEEGICTFYSPKGFLINKVIEDFINSVEEDASGQGQFEISDDEPDRNEQSYETITFSPQIEGLPIIKNKYLITNKY